MPGEVSDLPKISDLPKEPTNPAYIAAAPLPNSANCATKGNDTRSSAMTTKATPGANLGHATAANCTQMQLPATTTPRPAQVPRRKRTTARNPAENSELKKPKCPDGCITETDDEDDASSVFTTSTAVEQDLERTSEYNAEMSPNAGAWTEVQKRKRKIKPPHLHESDRRREPFLLFRRPATRQRPGAKDHAKPPRSGWEFTSKEKLPVIRRAPAFRQGNGVCSERVTNAGGAPACFHANWPEAVVQGPDINDPDRFLEYAGPLHQPFRAPDTNSGSYLPPPPKPMEKCTCVLYCDSPYNNRPRRTLRATGANDMPSEWHVTLETGAEACVAKSHFDAAFAALDRLG
ncbi:hypothetical protein HPB47_015849 [Ixodes persulcatus]|uniref:Uncharacterized protein n=1 Tax=Ixodes persulcatus TaxID=34615 RepID=A0AC60QTL4_IXOPE|nr:hypothetical protein HPB47_015849 [Ixodes persulcatus]